MTRETPRIIADEKIPFLKGRLEPFATVTYLPADLITPQAVREADALLIRTRTGCDARLLDGSDVKCIATATIGTDHIDLDYCRSRGITVCNAPGCNAPGVAQWVWSAILSQSNAPEELTVGVVGVGNVGRIVAQWGRALGCHILINDPPREERGDSPLPIASHWSSLEEIISRADVITVHTPLTRSGSHPTFHLFDDDIIRKIPSGSLILNAARGGIIDENALIPHLVKGRLTAIIDTWENEPDINRETLANSLLATPHIAGYSYEGKQCATRMGVEALARYFGFQGIDLSDLPSPSRHYHPSAEGITESYNLTEDAIPLFLHPEQFEKLRSDYNFRHEPK